MNLKLLSPNLNIILEEVLKNQKICKLLKYVNDPYSKPDIEDTDTLLFEKLYPFPFDPEVETNEGTQLRVYYGRIQLKNAQVIENSTVCFDIICSKSKSVWLVEGYGETRMHEIASEIVSHFSKDSIGTLGKLTFSDIVPFYINPKFDGIRVIGKMMTIGR